MSFRHHEIATAGETRQTDVILDPTHIFHGRRTIVLFLGGKMHATRRSQTAKPARPSPLIKSPDSVKKDCMARNGARFGGRRFSISLYTAFQMMTEIKHTLWCRSLRLPVVCPVGGGGAEVCVERDCGELFLFRPPPPRLPRPTDAAGDDDISNF